MSQRSFWEELKRRNVLRVGAFYAGASWLLVQVATQVFPFFDVPNWTVRLVVIAAVVGFPVALAVAWFYELTPQGLKLESEMAADATIPRSSGRRLDRWIIAVLSLAVVVLVVGLFVQRRTPATADSHVADAADKSVAVLPFQNLSDDKSNAYFAQGIQDEILTRLAKVGALRVISRSSTASLASAPDNLPEIASRLGVENFLEGSVQKIGDQVHINVQLIHAMTNDHLWAETYDRKLDNIFGVEGEVAQAIAEALSARLSGAEHQSMSEAPTENAQAYDFYLRGLSLELQTQTNHDVVDAAEQFQKAVDADPKFALAWAHLSIADSLIYWDEFDHTSARIELTRVAAETAMRLAPELGEAWLARGYYFYRGRTDYAAALADFEHAGRLLPNSGEVPAAIGYVQRRLGKFDEALANLQTATRRDPRNISYWNGVGEIYKALRRYPEALKTYDRTVEIDPGSVAQRVQRAGLLVDSGDLDAARKAMDAFPKDIDFEPVQMMRCRLLFQARDYASMITLIQQLMARTAPLNETDFTDEYTLLGAAQYLKGDRAAASATLQAGRDRVLKARAAGNDSAGLSHELGIIEALLGNRSGAEAEGRHGVELAGTDAWEGPIALKSQFGVLTLLGESEAAITGLQKLVHVPNGLDLGDARFDPIWDPLRSDPRFAAIVTAAESPLSVSAP